MHQSQRSPGEPGLDALLQGKPERIQTPATNWITFIRTNKWHPHLYFDNRFSSCILLNPTCGINWTIKLKLRSSTLSTLTRCSQVSLREVTQRGQRLALLPLVVTSSSLHPTVWILREQEAQHFTSACTSVLSLSLRELSTVASGWIPLKLFLFRILTICHVTLLLKRLSFSNHSAREVKRTHFHAFRFTTIPFLACD